MDPNVDDYIESNKPTIIVSLTKRNENKNIGDTSDSNFQADRKDG